MRNQRQASKLWITLAVLMALSLTPWADAQEKSADAAKQSDSQQTAQSAPGGKPEPQRTVSFTVSGRGGGLIVVRDEKGETVSIIETALVTPFNQMTPEALEAQAQWREQFAEQMAKRQEERTVRRAEQETGAQQQREVDQKAQERAQEDEAIRQNARSEMTRGATPVLPESARRRMGRSSAIPRKESKRNMMVSIPPHLLR